MFSLENDYGEGACQQVLDYLIEHNNVQTPGYGLDEYCFLAAELIKKHFNDNNCDIHFITGGTPCNILAISLLKPYEAVICVDSGHINVHETGAIEAVGHKILSVKGIDGRITAKEIEDVVLSHPDEHMVKPKMVFVSNATEYGTIYSKKQLKEIKDICQKYNLYLYLDGARLGNAIKADDNDLTLNDIYELTDIFYIGATKNGALLGEAMVIKNDELKPYFRHLMKRQGAMLAKSRIIGQQFVALFQDDTYFNNALNANNKAQQLKNILTEYGIQMYIQSSTNQIFPIIRNDLLKYLEDKYIFIKWGKYDQEHTIVRFVCSWATKQQQIDEFKEYLYNYK